MMHFQGCRFGSQEEADDEGVEDPDVLLRRCQRRLREGRAQAAEEEGEGEKEGESQEEEAQKTHGRY